jgi:hypothetical protein
MRITRAKLLDLALKETERRAANGDVISGYVIGSVAVGDSLVGGSGDVDLVLIHELEPGTSREIVPLSNDVHLDIHNHPKRLYAQPVELRHHPWQGPAMCEPAFLYDPSHFFEWAQAAVRGQFHRPDHVHARAVAFLARARRALGQIGARQRWLAEYLSAVLETANAAASLAGFPPAGRRLGLQLRERLEAVSQFELFDRFQRLLGADRISKRVCSDWTALWTRAFDTASAEQAARRSEQRESYRASDGQHQLSTNSSSQVAEIAIDPEISLDRRSYFLAAFQSMIEDGNGEFILWPMLMSWERSMQSDRQPEEHRRHWSGVLETLRLSPKHASRRESELEQLQDHVEVVLETWAERVGA